MFWADQAARAVEDRVNSEPTLKKVVKERGYIVYDEKTPSGVIHIGAGRGWLIHDIIAKTMRDIGMKARFILSSDDIDPFDKLPSYLDKSYEKYLGIPFRDIPSPVGGYKSYANYYFSQCTEKFEEFGIEAELESTGERYKKGDFNPAIKKALDNADKIRAIYERIYGKSVGAEKLPFNPICEKCGRIGTTYPQKWDSEREVISYECREDVVTWAKGCGYKGEMSPYNGNGKLPWKVEWAAKWPTVGVVYEMAGKDHFTLGGSRTVSVAICNEIYDYPPPLPSTRTEIGQGYEFFNIEGKKMSTSKGRGIGFVDITNYMPANLVRFLMVKTRPTTHIDFDPKGYTLPMLYDEYDKYERAYYGVEKVENERDLNQMKRIYELSQIGGKQKSAPVQVPFALIATLVQTVPENKMLEVVKEKLSKFGYFKKLDGENERRLEERAQFAKKWVERFAPDELKISFVEDADAVRDKIDKSLAPVFAEVADILEKKAWKEDELQKAMYAVVKEKGMRPPEFFRNAYLALVGRERGPRLASLILALGNDKVTKRFREVAL